MDAQHTMQLKARYSSGGEEWHCHTCNRRILIQMRPVFEKTVLSAGDHHVSHTGGLAGSAAHSLADAEHQSYDHESVDDATDNNPDPENSISALRPWVRWAREAGFDDLWSLA